MLIEGTFLRSRVARRIFLMYCLAALAPTLVLSVFAYRTASEGALEADQQNAVAASKGLALSVYERLDLAHRTLERIAAGEAASSGDLPDVAPIFRSIERSGGAATAAPGDTGEAGPSPDDSRAQPLRLRVTEPTGPGHDPAVELVAVSGDVVLRAQLDPRYLWGALDEFPVDREMCAFSDTGRRLFCSVPASDLRAAAKPTLVGSWDLFLGARFNAGSWAFRTTIPSRSVSDAFPGLSYVLAGTWAGVLLLALLLSLVQIRRSMRPLEELINQTRQVGSEVSPARITSSDEFGELAGAFQQMGARISRHLTTLKSLSDVDRHILARDGMPDIVDLVIERLRVLVPDAAHCVMYQQATDGDRAQWHLREAGGTSTQRSVAVAPPADASFAGQSWTALADDPPVEPAAALHRLGAREMLLRMATGGSGRVWIAIGRIGTGSAEASGDLAHEVAELASRLAVALAAREHEESLVHQARHDLLTGLPNRLAAQEAMTAALEEAAAARERFAVLFLDLDRFKAINDGLGHLSGDLVLVGVADVLRARLHDAAPLARLGGDEFLAVLRRLPDRAAAAHAAERIAAAFAAPIVVQGMEFVISASIGIALYPEDGTGVEALMRSADIAMYRAKARGGDGYAFFDERMNQRAVDRIRLENDLRHALNANQIVAHFQPRVEHPGGRIVAVEALARWNHPTRGAIAAAEFVSLAEECGLIEALGTTVLRQACMQFAQWRDAGWGLDSVSVNVSSRQLRAESFAHLIEDTMREFGIGRGELEIEITESVLVDDLELTTARLETVRSLGAGIAIDDFGTGYSSLAYLRTLPVDTLKVDRRFIVDIEHSADASALARAIIALGHATGKRLVAEGVEHTGQADLLHSWGCDLVQGFLHFPALPAAVLGRVLASARMDLAAPADRG
jgi:diguanylate cyclase (GGDEF)-like protein